jgi:TPR repeat protein
MHPTVQRLLDMAKHVHVDGLPAATLFEEFVDLRRQRGDEVLGIALNRLAECDGSAECTEVLDSMCAWLLEQPGEELAQAALYLLELLAEQGIPRAIYNLAVALRKQGLHGVAYAQLLRVVDAPDCETYVRAHALFALGEHLADGVGCQRDLTRAFGCFSEAADLGHPEACFVAGIFLHGKEPGWAGCKDHNLAARYYEKALALGVDKARTNLGCLHAMRTIDGARPEYGFALLRESAAEGDEVAHQALEVIGGPRPFLTQQRVTGAKMPQREPRGSEWSSRGPLRPRGRCR